MNSMKILAVCLLLLGTCFAQNPVRVAPDCQIGINATGAVFSNIYDNRFDGCVNWTMFYTSTGFSALSIQIEQAPDSSEQPGSWVVWPATQVGTGTHPMTAITNQAISVQGFAPWVRWNITSVTGTGKIKGMLLGWKANTPNDVNALPGTFSSGTADPCASGNIAKVTAAISSLAANTELIAGTAGQTIYVCGFLVVANSGTTPTVQFISSATSGNACATSPTNRTGVMQPTVGTPVQHGGAGATIIATAAGNALCIAITGTTPVISGFISLVKR
jgi:hypothetical protein